MKRCQASCDLLEAPLQFSRKFGAKTGLAAFCAYAWYRSTAARCGEALNLALQFEEEMLSHLSWVLEAAGLEKAHDRSWLLTVVLALQDPTSVIILSTAAIHNPKSLRSLAHP